MPSVSLSIKQRPPAKYPPGLAGGLNEIIYTKAVWKLQTTQM